MRPSGPLQPCSRLRFSVLTRGGNVIRVLHALARLALSTALVLASTTTANAGLLLHYGAPEVTELDSVNASDELRAIATSAPAPFVAAPGQLTSGSLVRASWYGPGFYGNRTACGQTMSTTLQGVAHRTLACGTSVTLTYGGATVTVPVVDRGPFVAGREFDLTYATRVALGCPDICTLFWSR